MIGSTSGIGKAFNVFDGENWQRPADIVRSVALSAGYAAVGVVAGWGVFRLSALFRRGGGSAAELALERLVTRMGFDPRSRMVAEIEGDAERFFTSAPVAELIADLQRARRINPLMEIYRKMGRRCFESKEEAMQALGITENGRTVSVAFDRTTGLVRATYVAGYYEETRFCRGITHYGLPDTIDLYKAVPLRSGRGLAMPVSCHDLGRPTEV